MVLRAHWLPRLENEEADALTNFEFRHFDPKKRIEVQLADLKFAVLDDLFREGEAYVEELEKAKAQQRSVRLAEAQPVAKKRKAAGESLRERDKW